MSQENENTRKKGISLDWLIGGVLSKVGDTFDRITGRNWNPSSSLATSKLEEKLKLLMDSEIRETENGGRFVPHLFRLKIQWNKFSTDTDAELEKLEHVLHAAAIDHINDKLYHTYAPIVVSVEKDYFVEGVQFIAGFGEFGTSPDEEVAVHVTLGKVPVEGAKPVEAPVKTAEESAPQSVEVDFMFELSGRNHMRRAVFGDKRRLSIGRGATNDIVIDDASVSKSHAAIALKSGGGVVIADTGSTNGTFIEGRRMPYGKAQPLQNGSKIGIGEVRVQVAIKKGAEAPGEAEDTQAPVVEADVPAPTVASIKTLEETDDNPAATEAAITIEEEVSSGGDDESEWEI